MARKIYYITLDVESVNKPKENSDLFPTVYDLGYLIHDRKGNVLCARSFVVKEGFNRFLEKGFYDYVGFYAKKAQNKYMPKLLKNEWENVRDEWIPLHLGEIREIFLTDIQKYNVSVIQAYNASFDIQELNYSWQVLTGEKSFFPDNLAFYDLWTQACETIAQKKKYKKWCDTYNFKTPKGNYKTSAEVVYSFLTKQPYFKELHTGLEDCYIELEIFKAIQKEHKKTTKGITEDPWKLVNNF
jgi:hypothetical protein